MFGRLKCCINPHSRFQCRHRFQPFTHRFSSVYLPFSDRFSPFLPFSEKPPVAENHGDTERAKIRKPGMQELNEQNRPNHRNSFPGFLASLLIALFGSVPQ